MQLTRYAVKGKVVNKNKAVMTTNGIVAFVKKGVTNWSFYISKVKAIARQKVKVSFVTVSADWLNTQQALEKGVAVVYSAFCHADTVLMYNRLTLSMCKM